MKGFAKFLVVSVAALVVAGCATQETYIPKVPATVQAKLQDYFAQPGNKAFVLAVDPGGDFAFGYDYGKPTVKEALEVATVKCDGSRHDNNILAKPYIYAINDNVVYEKVIRNDQEK